MNAAIWRSLLWKEWREHRWKLAALLVVVVGLHVWSLTASGRFALPDDAPVMATLLLVLPIGSAFVAMGLAASERSQRTAPFLRSLPLDSRCVAVTKLLAGITTIVAVQALAVLLTQCRLLAVDSLNTTVATGSSNPFHNLHRLFETGHWSVTALLISLMIAASLILWIAAPAVNSESEVRAGAIGLIVVVSCWTLLAWGLYLFADTSSSDPLQRMVVSHIAAMLPGGIWVALLWMQNETGQSFLIIPYLLSHVPLAWWYINRFGHSGDRERVRLNDAPPLVAPVPVWLGPARRSPLTALLWKHARECAPIVLAGAIGAVGIAITVVCVEYQYDKTMSLLELTSGSVLVGFMTLGCCAGLVCGAGVLTSELEPRLFTFWRTRPISIDLWFAIAFLGGLALLLVVFGVPVVLAYQFIMPENRQSEPAPSAVLAILVLSYVSGAFTASFVRNAVYASLLGLGVMAGFGVMAAWFANEASEWIDAPAAWLGVATLAFSAVLGVAAWVCVRNDWSLRLS
jgi:hypothetical protein